MEKKFVFVILHYYTINDTIECVNSIKKLENSDNIEIVIVDNASPNGTGKEIQNMYKDKKDIHVIISKENLGFARGNNLGFEYAKKELKADFIIMINNDVYMLQENFCDLILKEYNKSKFAILGPRIIMNNNVICSYHDKLPELKQLKKDRQDKKILYNFNKVYLRKFYSLVIKIKEKFKLKEQVDTSKRKEDVVLHGCCIIFSKAYIDKFDGIDNRTFLYYEEPLLYLRIKNNNMKSVYNPYLIIYHNESSSTNKSNTNKRKKFERVLKNEIKSLNILISELEKEKKNV